MHIWDRLELSRARMDDLRHLLSFVYKPVSDTYDAIALWRNPFNSDDCVSMPALVGRAGRERLFGELAEMGEIHVGENGRCERDAVKCASQLYSRFSLARRSDFTPSRPARPILFFDGTGGSLGKCICHAELGSADFVGESKQSRPSSRTAGRARTLCRKLSPPPRPGGRDEVPEIRGVFLFHTQVNTL